MAAESTSISILYRCLRTRLCSGTKPVLGGQQGFTLVELLVAMSLMAIGIFAVIGMQLFSMNSDRIAHRLTVASSLAQQVFEDIMLWDPATAKGQCFVSAGTYPYYADPNNPSAATYTVPGAGTFTPTYTTTLGTGGNGVPTGVTKVVVTVTGAGRSISITGFKRRV
ncbi:hypothetical protein GMLC_04220 [Geomonas limicola]|uniref:Prepilin-type N-terminal cleavage/methylation domain-containing protein n=1 Tax=Geomonas limicola TaxID=2740186 RepID=A0A6V8N5E5_9BACT|nr:prepilin-type N-terminal cleavage/methylation domain-containing protein [Geomonas limicola]GFO66843.1 hypothetical protein GMLC_04220 [Geomonas limicola]